MRSRSEEVTRAQAPWGRRHALACFPSTPRPSTRHPSRERGPSLPAAMARQLPLRMAMPRCIEEIMNRELLAVVPETPVRAIRELLRTFEVGAVPVVDEDRRPLGMVTAGAVLDATGTASDRMTRPAPCVESSTGIESAARQLTGADVHHLVVVDSSGVAVGIVSVLDLLRAMF